MDHILLALIPSSESDDDADASSWQDLADRSAELIERLKEIVEVEQEKMYVSTVMAIVLPHV